MQEPQATIISDTIWKHSAKNAIPLEMSKTILKNKGQCPLKIETVHVPHRYSTGQSISANQLFSPRPKGVALPSGQKILICAVQFRNWANLQIARKHISTKTRNILSTAASRTHIFTNVAASNRTRSIKILHHCSTQLGVTCFSLVSARVKFS